MLQKIFFQKKLQTLSAVGLPFLFFVFHTLLFKGWIVDDAGISFAYSRSFALGYGFVSQPGMPPVEGFSNFTWVLLLSPFFVARIFDPIITPKTISVILIFVSFLAVQKTLKPVSKHSNIGTFIVLTLLASNTSFVIWTISGLENPLNVLLVSLILLQLNKFNRDGINNTKLAISISLLSALCALTRPDGIIFISAFPLSVCIYVAVGKFQFKDCTKLIALYVGVFVLIFGSYMLFRYFYFDDIFPNTFYAKGGSLSFSPDEWYEKTTHIFKSAGVSKIFFWGLLAMFIYLGITKRITYHYFNVLIMLISAMLIYVLLPYDWMPEFRFATPFFLLFYLFIFLTGDMIYEKAKTFRLEKPVGISIILFTILFAGTSMAAFFIRSKNFAKIPTVPFTSVAELYGVRFNNYARKIGIKDGSILTPDLGGTLFYSHLKVYDLAGLTDKIIAKTLGKNQRVFYDYVFDTVKPTFIHTHGFWTHIANFDSDPRFRQNYIVIDELTDSLKHAKTDIAKFSGDFIRIDSYKNFELLMNIQTASIKK
jgi:hypothetical protein